jgi:periplasmic divalent cation tolerance protein
MTGLLQVTTATETRDQALALAGKAVQLRLAASAQIVGPVTSAFWHLHEFGTGEEWSVVLLTTNEKYAELESFLLANHPWQNPQVTAVAIAVASAQNIDWARTALSDRSESP